MNEKKEVILRYNIEIKEISSQKSALKSQIDEYEHKIKSLIGDLESQSKRHMKEVNLVHE
mgnify:CR=1 FL=1